MMSFLVVDELAVGRCVKRVFSFYMISLLSEHTKSNFCSLKCLKTTMSLLYALLSCEPLISQMFPTKFKLREIHYCIQGKGVFHFVAWC